MPGKSAWWRLVLLMFVLGLTSCRATPGGQEQEIAEVAPTGSVLTIDAPTPPAPIDLPFIENDAPAGICENTANILSRIDRAPEALFRAVALDNRVGQNDGDGIRFVRFAIVGDDLEYLIDEETAPYCILGGNEPDCGEWPHDAAGRYTWGVGGPVVQPGRYDVFVEVVGVAPDSLSGSDRCNWNFSMQIVGE